MLKGTAVTEITIPSTVTKSTGSWNGTLAGADRLSTVTFAPGTTAIPASICASDDFISAIDEVVIPSGVKSIGAKAFYDCIMLKTLQLPDSVTTIASDAFSGMDLEAVYIPCEDSDVAITLIDMEVPFIAQQTGRKYDSSDRLDPSGSSYYVATNSVTNSGQVSMVIKYAFKNSVKNVVTDLKMEIRIPENETIIYDTLKVDDKPVEYKEDAGRITFALDKPSGTIRFSVDPQDASYLMSYARINFKLNGISCKEVVGIVNMAKDVLTLSVPNETPLVSITTQGVTTPNAEVELYIDGVSMGTVTASASGSYSKKLVLPQTEEGKSYKVEARVTSESGKETTASAYVTYSSAAPVMTEFTMHFRGKKYDMLSMGATTPVITWASGSPFTFVVDFDDCSKVGEVRVVSRKSGTENVLEMQYDAAQDAFVGTGFKGYVPDIITAEYKPNEPSIYDDAQIEIQQAYTSESGAEGRESHIVIEESGLDFYYIQEFEENVSFTYDSNMIQYFQGGKTYYVNLEMVPLERNGGCFSVREIYVQEPDGTFSVMRSGVGLYEATGAAAEASVFALARKNDYKDLWESANKLANVLEDDNDKYDDDATYLALKDYISESRKKLDPKDKNYARDKYNLDQAEAYLGFYKIQRSGRRAIEKTQDYIDKSYDISDDPDILPSDAFKKRTDECVDAMEDAARKEENRTFRKIIKMLIDGEDSIYERQMEEMEEEYKKSKSTKMKAAIAPSGYVYEAVDSNRVENVKATIYYKETMDSAAVLWDATEYDQLNPLYTDDRGWYAWDVPEGFWQIRYEKDGYETASSDWLPVPPPQLNVNVGIVSTKAPKVALIGAYSNKVELVFSQYMDVSTVTGDTVKLSMNGTELAGIWQAVDSEQSPANADAIYATTFRFAPETLLSGEVSCEINGAVNYAGTAMESAHSQVLPVKKVITSVKVDDVELRYGSSSELTIKAEPGAAATMSPV